MNAKRGGVMKEALLLALVVTSALPGCDDGAGPDDRINGRYELRTVNGSALPYTVIALGNDRLEILSGFVQANADGTFSAAITSRITQGGQTSTISDGDTGTWTQSGNQVSFRSTDGTVSTGVVTGNQIVVVVDNISLVFSK